MCEVLDRAEQRGIEIGRTQGLEQGLERGITLGQLEKARDMALKLRDSGMMTEPAAIAEFVGVPLRQVEEWFTAPGL